MGKVVVKLITGGVGELLNSEWAASCCKEAAAKVARRAGDGYEVQPPHRTGQRVAVNVNAATPEARRQNAEGNVLLRALG